VSLLYLFTDSDAIVQTFEDYEEMCQGAEACDQGMELPETASHAFQYGYAQEYHERERHEAK
jgi:hypothetical protein